jgi:hypothetical protein
MIRHKYSVFFTHHPAGKRLGECGCLKQGEVAVEGLVAGDSVFQSQESAEEGFLASSVFGDLVPPVGSAAGHTHGDGKMSVNV